MEEYKDIIVWVVMGFLALYKIFLEPFLKNTKKDAPKHTKPQPQLQTKTAKQPQKDTLPEYLEVENYVDALSRSQKIVMNDSFAQGRHPLPHKHKQSNSMEVVEDKFIDVNLQGVDEWKKAFLYSEIFQRKY